MNNKLYNFTLEFPFGINGENLLITTIDNKIGVVSSMTTKECGILSIEKLREDSCEFRGFYRTNIPVEQLPSLEKCVLYAKCYNNVYKLGKISKNMETIELLARESNLVDDKNLGFVDDLNFRVTHKLVTKDEIDGIYFTKTSVLEEFKEIEKKSKIL